MSVPTVSVIMPVYNGERYLREAVESILNQTFADFEFVVINDGSTDGTQAILESYADPRLVLIEQENQGGVVASLNKGLELARGEYLARQDADDVSLPSRLACQVEFLEKNPRVGVLGTQMEIMDASENKVGFFKVPYSHSMIAWTLLFDRCFAHPSVVIRKKILEMAGGYDTSFEVAEDHELWTRLVELTRFANLPAALVRYRTHVDAVCRQQATEQSTKVLLARQRLLSRVTGKEFPLEILDWLKRSQSKKDVLSDGRIKEVVTLILEAYSAFNAKGLFIDNELGEVYADLQDRILTASRSALPFFESLSHSELADKYWRSVMPQTILQVASGLVHPKRTVTSFLQRTLSSKRHGEHSCGKETVVPVDGGTSAECLTVKGKKEGISLIVLSYERMKGLRTLLRNLLNQDLNGIAIELILCNNSSRIHLNTSPYSRIGRLLRRFDDVKIFNSSYNWRCRARYAAATLAKFETILFLDDDLIIIDPIFVRYMFENFQNVSDVDMISCWSSLWIECTEHYFSHVSLTFRTPEITELTECDTCGPGICMFSKQILMNPRVLDVIYSPDYPRADDMGFSIIVAMEHGSLRYFLPSYGMLKFHEMSEKAPLYNHPNHYRELYALYKSLYKSGYTPVLGRLPSSATKSDSPEQRAAQLLPAVKHPW